jgi:hypothetical protein
VVKGASPEDKVSIERKRSHPMSMIFEDVKLPALDIYENM